MPTDRKSVELNIPATAEERELLRISGGWDRWYGSLPQDLRRRLSLHDFKRLGDCFRQAFDIPDSHRPAAHEDAQDARRYRWLRQQHWNTARLFVIAGTKDCVRIGTYCPSEELLDDAIDAAMKNAALAEEGR